MTVPGRMAALLAAAALALGPAACADRAEDSRAPLAPDATWTVPETARPTAAEIAPVADTAPAGMAPGHAYSLAEVIDIAERRNKATRIAWEQARQAALAVGIAEAAYLPTLTASAIGGYQHVALPFPSNLAPRGYITATTQEALPTLAVTYLLLDFGRRDAATAAATQLSTVANVTFNRAHQQVVVDVARDYFLLDAANAALRAGEQALHSAQELQSAAEAQFHGGLATTVAVDLARRDTAQRRFDVAQLRAATHDARYRLLRAMDLPPATPLLIADISGRPLRPPSRVALRRLFAEALRERPDLIAAVARLRATDAGIAAARADEMPTLALSGNVQGNLGRISVNGAPYEGVAQPQEGVFLQFRWPLFEGGALRDRVRIAESKRAEAADSLADLRDEALREVASADDQLDASLAQYQAARALLAAAQTAFDSAGAAYRNGVGTYTDAVTAESALAGARAAMARAHSQALIDAAALAFATGEVNASLVAGLPGTAP